MRNSYAKQHSLLESSKVEERIAEQEGVKIVSYNSSWIDFGENGFFKTLFLVR